MYGFRTRQIHLADWSLEINHSILNEAPMPGKEKKSKERRTFVLNAPLRRNAIFSQVIDANSITLFNVMAKIIMARDSTYFI